MKYLPISSITIGGVIAVTAGLTLSLFALNGRTHRQHQNPVTSVQEADTDGPDQALRWRRLAWVDENGQIPSGALERAIRQKALLGQKHSMLAGDNWVEQGPANLSGRSSCMAIDPNNPLTIWMGTAGGGIWKSTDGGTTWAAQGTTFKSLAVNALALDPVDKKTLFAGTGEGYFNGDALSGSGMYKSTDGGTTWSQVPGTTSWSHINRIAICPTNDKVILVTAQYGGIYRSTDGGATWSNPLNAQSGHAVAFSPVNSNRVIGTIQDYNFSTSQWYAAAVVSTDQGATWKKATGTLGNLVGFGRIETAPVPTDQNSVYASASDGAVYKSTDGGASYAKVTTSGSSGASWYGNAIWVDPTDSSRIVVGGTHCFRSTDGGVTLTQISNGYIQTNAAHPDIHFFMQSPSFGASNKTVYVCTDGGLYQATDITTVSTSTGWLRRDQGARSTQYYSVAGDATTGRIVGGLQDNGTQSNLFGNNQANYVFGGDGGYVAMDPNNSNLIYGEYINLKLFHNNDGGSGTNTQYIYSGISDAGVNANFIAPFILDPNKSTTLLAGGLSLWRSVNANASSPSWAAIRSAGSDLISAIAVANGNSDIIWVGQNDGVVSKTTNGTSASPTWTTVGSGKLPSRYVTRILVDPANANTVYVTFGGFSSNNVWKTTDGGTNWVSITGTGSAVLPQVPVRTIARNPNNASILYVGTEIGIFSTADGGTTWTTSSDVNINVSVDELAYMNHSTRLLAGTHGRGVWSLDQNYSVTALALNASTMSGGNSCTGTVTISPAAPTGGLAVSLSSSSANAQVPATVTVAAGATTGTFTVTTSGVASSETLTISAGLSSGKKTANLTLVPASLYSLAVSPTSVVGGNKAIATVSLNGKAPSGGVSVTLSSSSASATVPATVTIPSGAYSTTYTVSTTGVLTSTTATLKAVLGTASKTATLTITPASLSSLTVSAGSVVGGSTTSITGTATLNGMAPAGGVSVSLSSSVPTAATVPTTITIPAGATSANFAITHLLVTTSQSVTLKATLGTATLSTTLAVNPFAVTSVTLNPTSVVGGNNSTGTVKINAIPNTKTGALTVNLSTPSTVVSIPSSVSIAASTSSASFTAKSVPVTSDTSATLTATYKSSSQQAILTVKAPTPTLFTVSPTSVKGSSTTVVTGTVTLSGNAPSAGVVVTLTSSKTSVVTVPATVTVASGKATISFVVNHKTVSSNTTVTLTAKANGVSVTTTLTVTP